jgi:cellobiose phosphorylase
VRRGSSLIVRPLLPRKWEAFDMHYRFGTSVYAITCTRATSAGTAGITCDGDRTPGESIALVDDGRTHAVAVLVWRAG